MAKNAEAKSASTGLQLREKQKVRRIYGVLERQFAGYYEKATKMKGVAGENLLQLLETRLDNVVYRMAIGASRAQARQLVMHGHITVNGRKVDIPSYQVQVGDVIAVREKSRNLDIVKDNVEAAQGRALPSWLEVNLEDLSARVAALPTRDRIDYPVQEQLIVEYYSR